MKLDTPLHIRYANADGPITPYRAAEPWTKDMQSDLQRAFEGAEQITPFVRRVNYQCPACEAPIGEIHFESVVFYGDDDWQHFKPVGEAQLITMRDCGHKYRREVSR